MAALLLAVVSTSCLDSDLEDLESYSGCDITSGQIYYRYYDKTSTLPGSGEVQVKQVRLARAVESDTENNIFTIAYVTGNVPDSEKANFTQSNVVIVVDISPAATIKPIGDSPQLGVPGDWSSSHQYEVTAANGDKKTWTIVVEPYQ